MKPTKPRRKSKRTHRCGVCREMREAIHAMCLECQGTDIECANCQLTPWPEWVKKWEEEE